MNILDFHKMKLEKRKITMTTCYDFWSARIIDESEIDCVLVGDSLAMVMHGHTSTIAADVETMALHTAAVARGTQKKFIVGDLPFLSYRGGVTESLRNVDRLMKAGAHSVKLEGVWGHEDVIRQIVGSGVPVMGHLGLTPQSIHQLGGFRVQGRSDAAARDLVEQAKKLEEFGAFAVVLECVPAALAKEITETISIPTIGIGAGVDVDGQVLVFQDLLGLNSGFSPKFLKRYLDGKTQILGALNAFHSEVQERQFPTDKETYT
jgi:3-methyl-2-oxobutanoate hydroxymethyltransferase